MAVIRIGALRKHQARFNGKCRWCPNAYKSGDWIVRIGAGKFVHLDCALERLP